MKSKKQTPGKRRANNFAVNFPDTDTIGGAAVINDSQMDIQQKPAYDPVPIIDPIISEVSFIAPSNGGGIVTAITPDKTPIDTDMNPIELGPQTALPQTTVDSSTSGTKKIPWALIVVAALVVAGVIYLSKKK